MENSSQNILFLSGEITGEIEYSHESHGCNFYTFKLKTKRLSGTYDIINVLVRDKLLDESALRPGDYVCTKSELRSFNKKTDAGNKLVVSAFAKEIEKSNTEVYENTLQLTGTICKDPVYRKTPLGREICDIMLAINRKYGRSDYLPLIVWGRNARIAESFSTGDTVTVIGRVQSREYIKIIDGEEVVKTTYEVSVSSIEEAVFEN